MGDVVATAAAAADESRASGKLTGPAVDTEAAGAAVPEDVIIVLLLGWTRVPVMLPVDDIPTREPVDAAVLTGGCCCCTCAGAVAADKAGGAASVVAATPPPPVAVVDAEAHTRSLSRK